MFEPASSKSTSCAAPSGLWFVSLAAEELSAWPIQASSVGIKRQGVRGRRKGGDEDNYGKEENQEDLRGKKEEN